MLRLFLSITTAIITSATITANPVNDNDSGRVKELLSIGTVARRNEVGVVVEPIEIQMYIL